MEIKYIRSMMRRLLIILVFSFFTRLAQAQRIDGTWKGVFITQTSTFSRVYYFLLEIKREGNRVFGLYSTSDSASYEPLTCMCSFSGDLPKKRSGLFEIYKEHLEEFDKKNIAYGTCDFVNSFSLHFFQDTALQILTGQWFSQNGKGPLPNGAGGSVVAYHLSNETLHDFDQYALTKEKFATRSTSVTNEETLIPDAFEKATTTETKLINTVKSLFFAKQDH